ncbi:hypothetical protein RHMOL_Rhmol02G0096700 [Rhododendron molle]|uniref:Uncharacterized protein n=2 Tax=Rhododendron molle TaxID=49168 RepID=A0ACC0PR25_RHOML|nr:hypothetical protein RHMOL_Rhmol02G0096700 [Rhododendron molle]KAI8567132.1 hypothetical protein RHMOL_Rhmol02G0096700 [Rhododendron molle]
MKNVASKSINPCDIRAVANFYATQIQLCCPHSPTSYPQARCIHAHMTTSGVKPRGHILNRLIDVYCKSSHLVSAHQLFDKIPLPDIVARTTMLATYSASRKPDMALEIFNTTPLRMRDTVFYNAMITAHCHDEDGHAAIKLFRDMRREGFSPDKFTFTSVLKLFDEMPVRDELTWTTIITGYVRNGDLDTARRVFEGMEEKLVVAWNAMILGYVHNGFVSEALEMFKRMNLSGIKLDEFTYTSVLSACASAGLFLFGKQVHAYILRMEDKLSRDFSLSVDNALITLYWKCGKVDEARMIFNNMPVRDLVSWNAILSSYVSAGRINEARSFFIEMPDRNLLTWTVIISGMAQNGLGEEGLKLFNQMKLEGLKPCDYAFAGAISSCAVVAALKHGCQLHAQLVRLGFDSSLSAGNALITMYTRCGVVEAAHYLFLTMPFVDSVSWNAMIAALGQYGHGAQALELFEQMLEEEILPDRITFLTILSACSHAGLVNQGRSYFDAMYGLYGIRPEEDHYARLIDLLCRAGKFFEAKDAIQRLPFEPGVPIWEALLDGCRIHGNVDLGVQAAERLLELRPQHDGTYILLSNMYVDVGRWDDMAKVRKLMRDRGVKKEPGCSWVEVENKVHVFLVDDTAHPEVQAVYNYLEELGMKMRELGYVPDTKYALHDVGSDKKQHGLSTHSEKLAVVFGLLKLPRGATVRVFKNLRICGDCHNAFKFMSKVIERDIVVRDGKRFHHFRNGECSCGNY